MACSLSFITLIYIVRFSVKNEITFKNFLSKIALDKKIEASKQIEYARRILQLMRFFFFIKTGYHNFMYL